MSRIAVLALSFSSMRLNPGTRLGPFEVVALIGPGEWARCIAPVTRVSVATSPSRFCPPPTPTSRRASRARPHHRGAETPAHLYPARHRRGARHRLPCHGIPGWGDTRRQTRARSHRPAEIVQRGIEVAQALDTAHRAGHRAPQSEARKHHADPRQASKLLDFGVARLRAPAAWPAASYHRGRHTPHRARVVLGTPGDLRRNSWKATRLTPAAICSRSGRSSTRW